MIACKPRSQDTKTPRHQTQKMHTCKLRKMLVAVSTSPGPEQQLQLTLYALDAAVNSAQSPRTFSYHTCGVVSSHQSGIQKDGGKAVGLLAMAELWLSLDRL